MTKILSILLLAGVIVSVLEWSPWPFVVAFLIVYITTGVLGVQEKHEKR